MYLKINSLFNFCFAFYLYVIFLENGSEERVEINETKLNRGESNDNNHNRFFTSFVVIGVSRARKIESDRNYQKKQGTCSRTWGFVEKGKIALYN